MKTTWLFVAALLLSACSSFTGLGTRRDATAPLVSGVLKSIASDNPSIAGGLLWSGTVKAGARCTIYESWIRIDASDEVIWIPRESVTHLELEPNSN